MSGEQSLLWPEWLYQCELSNHARVLFARLLWLDRHGDGLPILFTGRDFAEVTGVDARYYRGAVEQIVLARLARAKRQGENVYTFSDMAHSANHAGARLMLPAWATRLGLSPDALILLARLMFLTSGPGGWRCTVDAWWFHEVAGGGTEEFARAADELAGRGICRCERNGPGDNVIDFWDIRRICDERR